MLQEYVFEMNRELDKLRRNERECYQNNFSSCLSAVQNAGNIHKYIKKYPFNRDNRNDIKSFEPFVQSASEILGHVQRYAATALKNNIEKEKVIETLQDYEQKCYKNDVNSCLEAIKRGEDFKKNMEEKNILAMVHARDILLPIFDKVHTIISNVKAHLERKNNNTPSQNETTTPTISSLIADITGYTKSNVGKMCRGPNFDAPGWPKGMGYQTPEECSKLCSADSGCTGFDIARKGKDDGKFDCFLFGNNPIIPENGAKDAHCFTRDPSTKYWSWSSCALL